MELIAGHGVEEIIAGHVRALREGDDASKQEATRALLVLLGISSVMITDASGYLACKKVSKVLIAKAGGIPLLVALLREGTADGTPDVVRSLRILGYKNDANAVAIAMAVGLEALVKLARRGKVRFPQAKPRIKPLVRDAGVPAKRKAALVVAALLEAAAPRTRVSRYIKTAIAPYL